MSADETPMRGRSHSGAPFFFVGEGLLGGAPERQSGLEKAWVVAGELGEHLGRHGSQKKGVECVATLVEGSVVLFVRSGLGCCLQGIKSTNTKPPDLAGACVLVLWTVQNHRWDRAGEGEGKSKERRREKILAQEGACVEQIARQRGCKIPP